MKITTCVFDAYGTLFDVAAAAREAASESGHVKLRDSWKVIASDWRLKQLQYTWLRAITGEHADFWQVTCDGLDWALDAADLCEDESLRSRLLDLYRELKAYPEVLQMLADLRAMGLTTAILSNGTPDMLYDAVKAAGISDLLHATISVESVGVFKPHRSVYDLVGKHFGCRPAEVLFVSSNGWDAAAASGYGFGTVWVNRADEPMDRLPWTPSHVLSDLSGVKMLMN